MIAPLGNHSDAAFPSERRLWARPFARLNRNKPGLLRRDPGPPRQCHWCVCIYQLSTPLEMPAATADLAALNISIACTIVAELSLAASISFAALRDTESSQITADY